MALPERTTFLPLSKGIDQKIDGFQSPMGVLTKARNFKFNKIGRIDGIRGFGRFIESQRKGLNQIISPIGSLLAIDNESFYRVDGENYIKLSDISFSSSKSNFVHKSEEKITSSSLTIKDGEIYCVYYVNGEASYRYKRIRESDNRLIEQGTIINLGSATKRVKVFSYKGEILISYLLDEALNLYNLRLKSNKQIATGITDYDYSIKENSLDLISITNTQLKGFSFTTDLTVDPFSVSVNFPSEISTAREIYFHTDNTYSVTYSPSAADTQFKLAYGGVYDITRQLITAPSTFARYPRDLKSQSKTSVGKIGNKYFMFENSDGFQSYALDTTFSFFLAGFKLIGEVEIFGRTLLYVSHPEGAFLVDENKNIYAALNSNNGYALNEYDIGSYIVENDKLYTPQIRVTSIENAKLFEGNLEIGVGTTTEYVVLEFSDSAPVSFDEAKETAVISGSPPLYYDGTSITEYGFNHTPKFESLDNVDEGDQNFYQYAVIYKWIDGRGLEHRSAVVKKTITKTNPISASSTVEFKVTNLSLTSKKEVKIEVYRTGHNDTVLRRIASINSNPNTASTDIVDNNEDQNILSNEELYTNLTGSIVGNVQPESCTGVETYRNRMYLYGLEQDLGRIAVSQTFDFYNNRPVEFSGLFNIDLPDPIVSAKGLDDHLIIFTTRKIYRWNETLGTPIEIQTSEGIAPVSDKATFKFAHGIVFQTSKGIWMLNRGLSLSYLGKNVENFNNLRVIDINESRSDQEIYFLLEDRSVLVFNYFFRQWTTYLDKAVINMTINNNKLLFLSSDGFILDKDKEQIVDEENVYTLETSWISFGNIQGFNRFVEVIFLGQMNFVSYMVCYISYNYVEGSEEDIPINPSQFQNIEDTLSLGGTIGGNQNQKQVRIQPSFQECTSFKLKFHIKSKGAISLSNLGFKYQVNEIAGVQKIDQQLSYGGN